MKHFWLFCLSLLAMSPAAASAQDWAATFTAPAVRSHLPNTQRIIVVAAGADTAQAELAADALAQSLRNTSVPLVMSDDALGNVAADDDKAIVTKAQALPVDAVAVVRVFAGDTGAPPNVVVVVYDKPGAVLAAFNGKAGEPLAGPSATDGAQAQAMDAVAKITKSTDATSTDAQKKYDEQHLWFADMAAVNVGTGQVVASWSVAYRGKYKQPLEGAEFYDALGRDDLSKQYKHNLRIKRGLFWGGLGGMILGGGIALWGIGDAAVGKDTDVCKSESEYTGCYEYEKDKSYTKLVVGGVMWLGGLVTMTVSLAKRPHPIEAPEARRLVDEHNGKLRHELGLSDEAASGEQHAKAARPEQPATTLSFAPTVSRNAGSLSLRLQF